MLADREFWSHEVYGPEVESFRAQADELLGLTSSELHARLGTPDLVIPKGLQEVSASGEVLFVGDRDLWYGALLPHTIVSLTLLAGQVARITYSGKLKRCPPEVQVRAGALYAPE